MLWESVDDICNIFWVNGFGTLEAQLSPRDAQVIFHGIANLVDNKIAPPRTLHYDNNTSDFYNEHSNLGTTFFYGIYAPDKSISERCSKKVFYADGINIRRNCFSVPHHKKYGMPEMPVYPRALERLIKIKEESINEILKAYPDPEGGFFKWLLGPR